MQDSNKIKQYISAVCSQVRWKRSHVMITDELECHINDQADAYVAEGQEKDTAVENAILQMGDPIIVGNQLDGVHRPKPQWNMIILTAILLLAGIIIRGLLYGSPSSLNRLISEEILPIAIGICVMIGGYLLDFSLIGKYPKTVYFLCLAASIVIILCSPTINGRYYYASLICPLILPLAYVSCIYSTKGTGYLGILGCGLAIVPLLFIQIFIPVFFGAVITIFIGLLLLTLAIACNWYKVKRWIALLVVYIPTTICGIFFINGYGGFSYRLQQIINPDPNDSGYLIVKMRELLASSNFIGKADIEVLPIFKDHEYIILNAIAELGWISFFIIAIVLFSFIAAGFLLCIKQKNKLGLFVSVCIMSILSLQIIVYLINNLGVITLWFSTLPLISYGKVGMVINMFLIGILMSVFRSNGCVKDPVIKQKHKLLNKKLIIKFE